MAFMHRRLGHYDKAMELYKIAITTVKSEKELGLAASYLGIANILHDTHKDDEAMEYAKNLMPFTKNRI
ncbi:MAG: hypothetical protein IPP29_18430 [Bacteroidetes bacterium]|nr:hypothetical protein [Bacteroidota bacterium]